MAYLRLWTHLCFQQQPQLAEAVEPLALRNVEEFQPRPVVNLVEFLASQQLCHRMLNMDILATERSLPSKAPEDMFIVGWDPVIEEVPSGCAEHTTKATCGMCFALTEGSDNIIKQHDRYT